MTGARHLFLGCRPLKGGIAAGAQFEVCFENYTRNSVNPLNFRNHNNSVFVTGAGGLGALRAARRYYFPAA